MPEINLENLRGFNFYINGVFPFQDKPVSSFNSHKETVQSHSGYFFQSNLGGFYSMAFNPVFSLSLGYEYQLFENNSSDNQNLIQSIFHFQFILDFKLKASYSLEGRFSNIEIPFSYQHSLIKDLDIELKTSPVFFLDRNESQIKAWNNSVTFSYWVNENSSLGISFHSSTSFVHPHTYFYASVFLNWGF